MIQEAERLKWQAQRDADDRADRDKRDKEARDFQRDQAERARRHQNRSLTVSLVAIAVAIIGLITNTLIGLSKKPTAIVANPAITRPQPPQPAK